MSTIKVDTYLTRGGASEIAIDKLKGVTAAGSMLVVGEGGTTTTNLQQGLAKSWAAGDNSSGSTVTDSLNVASLTDVATGKTNVVYTTAMANVNYSGSYYTNANAGTGDYNFNNDYGGAFGIGSNGRTTALVQLGAYDDGNIDSSHNDVVIMGDLA